MSTYSFRISQGSDLSDTAVELATDEGACREAMCVFGDLARDFVKRLPNDFWQLEVLGPSGDRVITLTAHAE
jgi:hypothetical protein